MTDKTETANSPKHGNVLKQAVLHLLKDHAMAGGSGPASDRSLDLHAKLEAEMREEAHSHAKALADEPAKDATKDPAAATNGAGGESKPTGDGRRA